MHNSIVEYYSGHEGYRCGYCKSTDTNFSHGMWAHSISPAEYEGLLNRGWRRSGKYLYKPTNHLTCCPSYTINCHALEFRISKSQKKVLKKVNDFLLTGTGNLKTHCGAGDVGVGSADHKNLADVINYREGTPSADGVDLSNSKSQSSTFNIKVMGYPEQSAKLKTVSSEPAKVGTSKRRKSETSPAQPPTAIASQQCPPGQLKGKGQKAKFLRMERRRQKLVSEGFSPDEVIAQTKKTVPHAKEIEAFLLNIPNVKHKLEIRMVKVGSDDFISSFNLEHSIYHKYQLQIHNDEESECTPKRFRRFLCDNPINEVSDDDTGCYHQQYYLDDQLIAVGVVDVLPTCLSSVYFFYDPAFMDLTLGTYGALREIAFVRQRALTNPNFQFYYMGFYIHSCPKMRYKGNFTPSYLLCSEMYKWKRLDDELRQKLNQQPYLPFFTSDIAPSNSPQQQDINKVSILYRRNIVPYGIYELQRAKDDTREIQEYVNLVGVEIATNLCLYRSLM